MNSAPPTMPIRPVTAASGTWPSIKIHITAKAMPTALPGLSCAQSDMPAKIEQRVSGEAHDDDRQHDRDRGRDRIGFGVESLDVGGCLPDLVDGDDCLHHGRDREQRDDDEHERRHRPAQQHRRARLRLQGLRRR